MEECKERWKNLRACYTRHVKLSMYSGKGFKVRKPYYLAEYLDFLYPFTKCRQPKSYTPEVDFSESISHHEVKQEDPLDIEPLAEVENLDSELENSHESQNLTSPAKRMRKNPNESVTLSDINRSSLEYFQIKKQKPQPEKEDHDAMFLSSILPEMREMSNKQKRRFKIGVLRLADQILSENESSSQSTSVSRSSAVVGTHSE